MHSAAVILIECRLLHQLALTLAEQTIELCFDVTLVVPFMLPSIFSFFSFSVNHTHPPFYRDLRRVSRGPEGSLGSLKER